MIYKNEDNSIYGIESDLSELTALTLPEVNTSQDRQQIEEIIEVLNYILSELKHK